MKHNEAEQIEELAQKSRENLAKQIYNIDTILTKIKALADKGFTEYRIKPPYPVDTQNTNTAINFMKKIAGMGFSYRWLTVIYPPETDITKNGKTIDKKNETEVEQQISEMVIFWHKKSKLMKIIPNSDNEEVSKDTRFQ